MNQAHQWHKLLEARATLQVEYEENKSAVLNMKKLWKNMFHTWITNITTMHALITSHHIPRHIQPPQSFAVTDLYAASNIGVKSGVASITSSCSDLSLQNISYTGLRPGG